ncbi:MAG: Lon protease [Actinomycetota bacterium]|jgi:Lon protease-like protein
MLTPVFPLGTAYLPGDEVVLRVFEERYVQLIRDINDSNLSFASVLISQGSEVGGGDKRFSYGVMIDVINIALSDLGLIVQAIATDRIRVMEWEADDPYPRAEVEVVVNESLAQDRYHDAASSLSLLAQNVRTLRESIAALQSIDDPATTSAPLLNTIASGRWWTTGVSAQEVERAFWTVARHVPCGPMDRYELLQPPSVVERISRLRYMVEHVTEIVAFQRQK